MPSIEKSSNKPSTKETIQLAAKLWQEALVQQTWAEKRQQKMLARMLADPVGKAFTTTLTDQAFRSKNPERVADQVIYLLDAFGIPTFLSLDKKLGLYLFKLFGKKLSSIFVSLLRDMLLLETKSVILPGESDKLESHIKKRTQEGVRINLNRLGEAILGEEEAGRRVKIYLDDLANPNIQYISIKISTIFSQINLLAWENNLEILSQRLAQLYRAANAHFYQDLNGQVIPKFINLDMEEYKDLHLIVELFKSVLNHDEFKKHYAGIVLQSYLPDSFRLQQDLTEWAQNRVQKGGAPIKIRIVKGANMAMEQVEAALHGWPQAPYLTKAETDANFKKMLLYGTEPERIKAATLGIGSHNIFDIAYALLLKEQRNLGPYIEFEMLEGMADQLRRVLQNIVGRVLLYCPAAYKNEFQNAVAYLVRRLDENTAPENFLRHTFDLKVGNVTWNDQAKKFLVSCQETEEISELPRRQQNRFDQPNPLPFDGPFANEPDTDWTLPHNRVWAEKILHKWHAKAKEIIPLVIAGQEIISNLSNGFDPSVPNKVLFQYSLGSEKQLDSLFNAAGRAQEQWKKKPISERSLILAKVAQEFREHRNELIGAMIANTGKTIPEADVEVSEAIDFAEYYWRNAVEMHSFSDLSWDPKGIVLVAPPWNFPCSIPSGGILAALAAGNAVIFKPAPEAILVGWQLAQLFWNAGIDRDLLQFFNCDDDPVGSLLIKDPRLNTVILTGSTETAKLFLRMRPGLDLMAETGGKNAMIITAMSDRDLAIKDLIQSAFGHAGQKCSACSLAICEAQVYDDSHFLQQLKDAANSFKVGSAWDLSTKIPPLIRLPNPALARGLTTLEPGESWLLKPKQSPYNPQLWSPGIKLGVQAGSFTHKTELFGPVLGIMRAENLSHAIHLANATPYGLTAGLHSLDNREQQFWRDRIEAGNCYINRGITGAIVRRQPFGGCKDSSFGPGAKAGGPNYVQQLMRATQNSLPEKREQTSEIINNLEKQFSFFLKENLSKWRHIAENYTYNWKYYFSKIHDPSQILGEYNQFCYKPRKQVDIRIQDMNLFDICLIITCGCLCGSEITISLEASPWKADYFIEETELEFVERIKKEKINRVRFLTNPTPSLETQLANLSCASIVSPVLWNGRIELLNYLQEVCFSICHHRYGNITS